MGVKLCSPVSGKYIGTKNRPYSNFDAMERAQTNDFKKSVEDNAEAPERLSLADFPANENGEITSSPMGEAT
jgi:hypothetical protein